MNIVLLASHGIAEYDDVRMFHDMGYGIFAPGGYENPAQPGESLRPALPEVPYHRDLQEACNRRREEHARDDAMYAVDWAKHHLADEVVDWGDVFIVHHFPDRWIAANWNRLRGKRVVWRTCGQSNPELEAYMSEFRDLEIVRYSPAEERYFRQRGWFAGQTVLIRFGKYPADYGPWVGDDPVVGNVTQRMVERGDSVGHGFWQAATGGLPVRPAGPGSEQLRGGLGALGYDEMREYLRRCRAYLYTGTVPAPYTLGLIEAMLSGVPVVSIGPRAWAGPAELFEGHEIAPICASDPERAAVELRRLLDDRDHAAAYGEIGRTWAVHEFGIDTIAAQWREFLG